MASKASFITKGTKSSGITLWAQKGALEVSDFKTSTIKGESKLRLLG